MMAIIVVTHVPTTRANIVFLKLLASSRMPPISSRMLRVSSRWAAATACISARNSVPRLSTDL